MQLTWIGTASKIITTMDQIESKSRGRPYGVSLIVVLLWIMGFIFLVVSLSGGVAPLIGAPGSLGGLDIPILVLFGLASIIVGYGLWSLKEWSVWMAIIITGLDITRRFYGVLVSEYTATSDALGSYFNVAFMILEVAIIVYLFLQRKVFQEEQTLIEH